MSKTVTMHRVKSSNLHSIGQLGARLFVVFRPGDVYVYEGVPAKCGEAIASSESPGRAFALQIRGTFTGVKHKCSIRPTNDASAFEITLGPDGEPEMESGQ